jgi:hypothetical protein
MISAAIVGALGPNRRLSFTEGETAFILRDGCGVSLGPYRPPGELPGTPGRSDDDSM